MSIVGQYGNSGLSIILNSAIDSLTRTQTKLAWEASSNTLAETYADLGQGRTTVFNVTPKITQISAWQNNITYVQNNLASTSSALKNIVSVSQCVSTSLLSLMGAPNENNPTAITATAQQALSALTQIGNDLNTSDGNGYIFATVSNPFEKPVKNVSTLNSSPLYQNIYDVTQGLQQGKSVSSIIEKATQEASNNDPSLSLFSSSLSVTASDALSKQRSINIGDSSSNQITFGIVATQASPAGQATDPTTGSPMRDIIRDMMMVASMQNMSSSTPNFNEMVKELYNSLNKSINQVINMEQQVGVTQDSMKSQNSLLSNSQDMLKNQLYDARLCNEAQVATEMSQINNTLQASYTMIAKIKSLSLANYI